jgi:hypothetical protein
MARPPALQRDTPFRLIFVLLEHGDTEESEADQ